MSINNPESQDFVPNNNTSSLFSDNVKQRVAQAMSEIKPEFDEVYCAEYGYPELPWEGVDLDEVELFTEESTNIAYEMLHEQY